MFLITTAAIGAIVIITLFTALLLRRVVPTNTVHIVQSAKKTTSYGSGLKEGNTYYEWPSWLPVIGVTKIVLPVSVFDLDLEAYEAYDKGRLPFVVDVKAFFRINDTNLAAARVASFQEMEAQLEAIVQGAVRTIMANAELEEIMQGRSVYGQQFTEEVDAQLKNWGVETVKNIELMDIRDSGNSQVIKNIMEKKKSQIEMESRSAVAENMKKAKIAEITADRDADMELQNALMQVGQKTAEKDQAVGIANEQAKQEIKEQERATKEKEMAVAKVAQVRQAEITKEANIVKAEEEKVVTVTAAEAALEAQKKQAEGIQVEGQAKADAEKAMQLAPVEAQIVLAKEIGDNQGYQTYLITVEQIKAAQVVGVEQAKALEKADVKVIANSGDPVNGVTNVMEMFTSKGGTQVGAMLEALKQTPAGAALLDKITLTKGKGE